MLRYIFMRILWIFPILFGVIILSFVIAEISMANSSIDPVAMILPVDHTPEDYAAMRERLGLDLPVLERFLFYIANVLQGDFGISYQSGLPVIDMIMYRLPATLVLALWASLLSIFIAIPLGVFAAVRRNTIGDFGAMFFALLGLSMPGFWLGLLMMLIFGLYLGILPVQGIGGFEHLILPGFVLAVTMAASSTRLMRSSMLEKLGSDFIRTARAKGARKVRVIYKHALRNALIPVVTNFGLQTARMMGGAVVIEVVFAYPGLGNLTFQSIMFFDVPMLQGCLFIVALIFVLVNLIVDILYAFIDPRIEY